MKQFFTIIILCLTLSGSPPSAEADISDAVLVWSEQNSSGMYNIYLQSMKGEQWGEAVVVSSAGEVQTRPTAARDGNGNIWIAWILFKQDKGTIHYRYYGAAENEWQPERVLQTETGSDLAPELIVDKQGNIWLAYAGSDPELSNIYLTAWNSTGWNTPFQINTDDRSPDVKPHFCYNSDGRLTVSWMGFNRGGYTLYSSMLKDSGWSEERERVKNEHRQNSAKLLADLPKLPKTLQPANQGFLYFQGTKHPESHRFDK
jgi:hypothetical protein